jgi:hypothetical protein
VKPLRARRALYSHSTSHGAAVVRCVDDEDVARRNRIERELGTFIKRFTAARSRNQTTAERRLVRDIGNHARL